MNTAVSVLINGLSFSAVLFLLSIGLTLILGLARITNFAHGSIFVVGAYLSIAMANALDNWWLTLILTPLITAAFGALIEVLLIRRLYGKEEMLQIILTFGLVLVIEDGIKMFFGSRLYTLMSVPPALEGAFSLGSVVIPKGVIFVIFMSIVVGLTIWLLLYRTTMGKQINAAASDMEMTEALGLNVPRLFTLVFALGAGLAGLAGSLRCLSLSFLPAMGVDFLIYAFAVVVIGGMGSFKGSIYGSLIVAICYSVGIYFIPQYAMIFVFALLFLTLTVRPRGLFGVTEGVRPPSNKINPYSWHDHHGRATDIIRKMTRVGQIVLALTLVALPALIGEFWLFFATELLLLALLATSLNLLLRTGLLSLSHAAFFGLAAYTTALMLKHCSPSLWVVVPAGLLLAVVFAFIVGALSLRHIEIYFSLLTLAFAQFLYAVVYKWQSLTGGDDGLMGMQTLTLAPPGMSGGFLIDTPLRWYYLILVIIAVCAFLVWRILNSPFGQVLRALGQNTQRVAFLGLNPRAFKLGAFVVAGLFAGAAGTLFAPFQGLIGPSAAYWTKSIDPLFMNLIGGIHSTVGPSLGAVIYMVFREYLSSWTEYWKLWLGLCLVVIPVLMPLGAAHAIQKLAYKLIHAVSPPTPGVPEPARPAQEEER